LKSDNSYYHRYNFNTLDDALRMDIENYMAGDILVKIDRASMAHGLELRAPFLDVDLASFLISLPSCLKVTSDVDKFLLRQACSTLWPVSIQKRGKMGFGGPIYKWLLQDSVKILVDDFLKNRQRKIFSLLDYKQCHQIIANNEVQTWILLVLSLWMETHQFSLSV